MVTATRPKMTPEQATQFDRKSQTNAAIVSHTLSCGCEPYRDVFTYNRWQAQGFQVRRGEHSIKLAVIKTKEIENDDGGIELRRIFGNSHVFCRHQVDKAGAKQAYHAPATPVIIPVKPEPVAQPVMPNDNLMKGWRPL